MRASTTINMGKHAYKKISTLTDHAGALYAIAEKMSPYQACMPATCTRTFRGSVPVAISGATAQKSAKRYRG